MLQGEPQRDAIATLVERARSWIAFAAVAALAAGCVHAPLTCPAKGGAQWIELGSPHFLLRTDQAEFSARQQLVELEQRASLIAAHGFPSMPAIGKRLDVIVFDHSEDYAALFPELVDNAPEISMLGNNRMEVLGFFGSGKDAEHTPMIVMYLYDWRMPQHELVHWLMSLDLPRPAPLWLNEGMARLYETLEIDYEARQVIVGRPPHVGPRKDWPSARELIDDGGAGFHHKTRGLDFYSAAWMMIYILRHDHAAAFTAYREALRRGQPAVDAWREHLGGDWDAWDRELREYRIDLSDRPNAPIAERSPLPALDFSEPTSRRTLSDAEVHLLWAQLRDWSTPASRARARADLDEAARLAPESPDVKRWRARFDETAAPR